MDGLVTLLEANRPTVQTSGGSAYLCYLRGRIKRDVGRIMVGDRVQFEPTDAGEGRIDAVYPRRNQLVRPPVANVTGLFMVFTLASPVGSLEMLDKRLVAAHLNGLDAEVVLSKMDLADNAAEVDRVERAYHRAGYRVWRVSSTRGEGIASLVAESREGIWVLSGESGAGKSTLVGAMLPQAVVKTQELSRIGRGKQTTRWVRLYNMGSYWLADSPGYTALDISAPNTRAIAEAFGEFAAYRCRFQDCSHGPEPGCAVLAAVKAGQLEPWRYQHYRRLVEEWVKLY